MNTSVLLKEAERKESKRRHVFQLPQMQMRQWQFVKFVQLQLLLNCMCAAIFICRFMLDDHNAAVLTPSSDVFALVAEPEEIARRVPGLSLAP